MPLTLSLVTTPTSFDKIAPMDHTAWLTPYNPQLKHFRPSLATPAEAIAHQRAKSIAKWQKRDPYTFHVHVVDSDTDDVVGYALWVANMEPQAEAQPVAATWYEEGSVERAFAERFINGLWGFLGERVRGPHMDLHSIIVHPLHRHRGAGRMLLRWGTAKADELGIETVISSLPSAAGAYEKCGFGRIELIPADVEVEDPSARWKELQAEDLTGWLMWRPVGHDYVEGVDRAPWLEGKA